MKVNGVDANSANKPGIEIIDLMEANGVDKSDIGLENLVDLAKIDKVDKTGIDIANLVKTNRVDKLDIEIIIEDPRRQLAKK